MYEIGSGSKITEIEPVFDIECLSFTGNGRYLAMKSYTGSMAFWELNAKIVQNIQKVRESMQKSPNFWQNFPIYL